MTRCAWISGDLAEPLGCALPATVNGFCDGHDHDVATERKMDAQAELERDLIRAIYAQRAAGRSLEHLRPYLAAWFGGLIRRRIATALVTGETLDREHAHELGAILVALPSQRAMAAARGVEAGVFPNTEIALSVFRVGKTAVYSAMDVLGIERPAEHGGRPRGMSETEIDRAIALDGVPVAAPASETARAAAEARWKRDESGDDATGNDCPAHGPADRTTKNLRAILRAPEVVQELPGGAP